MDITYLTKIVTLLVTLSVATERIVEVIKGWVPWLNNQDVDPRKEGFRQAILHLLAVGGGCATATLAAPVVKTTLGIGQMDSINGLVFLIGLCASGGSGFWNSILTYLLKVKDIKASTADTARNQATAAKLDTAAKLAAATPEVLNLANLTK